MNNEDRELIHKGCKIYSDQQESFDALQLEINKERKVKRKESILIREILDEGIKVLNKRYGIKE